MIIGINATLAPAVILPHRIPVSPTKKYRPTVTGLVALLAVKLRAIINSFQTQINTTIAEAARPGCANGKTIL